MLTLALEITSIKEAIRSIPTTISFDFVCRSSMTEWVKSNIFVVTTRVTMKGKLERWFSKAWDLKTVSLFTFDSGFKKKKKKNPKCSQLKQTYLQISTDH